MMSIRRGAGAFAALLVLVAACAGAAHRSRSAGPGARPNPFEGATFYVDPEYTREVEASAKAHPAEAAKLSRVGTEPTAIWLDSIASVEHVAGALEHAGEQSKAGKPVLSVFVLYDLPNRDCAAKSSNGELSVENDGEARYEKEFVDPIAEQFRAHADGLIVAILEPDSLPNLATNLSVGRCGASEQAYRRGVAYAISKLALPNVSIYLDAAHAGWLGWDGNRIRAANVFKQVLLQAGGVDKIRGFATNVSNYNPIEGKDGRKLESSNPCPNELVYVEKLADTLASVGIRDVGFIIDTSRNGHGGIRTRWGNWCNVRGAGLGERPRALTDSLVDAYFWLKRPGESDGVSDPSAPRFDANCKSPDSVPDAPQAGQWFDSYFLELVRNANPPL